MKICLFVLLGLLSVSVCEGAEKTSSQGESVYQKTVGELTVKILPNSGCNVFSIQYKGQELLKTPADLKEVAGFMYGTPILYPSPNRIRNAEFEYKGKKYSFPANHENNFIHGLVHSSQWKVTKEWAESQRAGLVCELEFAPGSQRYSLFPFRHSIQVAIEVSQDNVTWKYTVDNQKGKESVPFGFALHPWILYQGKRESTFLTVPATHWMESFNQLPTGKLIPVTQTKYDATSPISLKEFVIDDVYFGMSAEKPASVDFRDANLKLSFGATEDFTHLVVYTPKDEPWFCIENQTSATDAHNLFNKGIERASHLQVVKPGETKSGSVSLGIQPYPPTKTI